MRIAIEPSASRLTFSSSFLRSLLIACIVGCGGCNALIDFGFKFGSDGGQEDAGPIDSGTPDAGDGGDNDASTCPSQSEDCSNDEDDDCDGMEDCGDPDCASTADCCRPNQIPEVSCSGGIDNDCDQTTDCADSDCSVSPLCCTASGPEVGATSCGDDTDNDCDGLVDCAELSCKGQAHCCDATGDETDATVCDDNIDNDCDGAKDCADSECFLTSACCAGTPAASETNCIDNVDEDCDGLFDCEDNECESNSTCAGCVASSDTELFCMDNVDDDCDLTRDCRDADCYDTPQCCAARGSRPESDVTACTDSTDNDCDGLTDCGDPDCSSQQFCCVGSPENTNEACRDTVDNDCDGLLNCGDDSCYGTTECCDETGSEDSDTACTDTTDNDCDGKLNCSDPDCAGTSVCCGATSGEPTTFGVGTCCVPDGMDEAAAPNDGRDNDCDGSVDRPVLKSAFPIEGLPSSGAEVSLEFMTEIDRTAQLQCWTRRVGSVEAPNFTACPMSDVFVKPFTAVASANPTNNGLWETQVLWRFGNGATSEVHTFRYYLHHTLHGVAHCPTPHTPQQWFAKAATRLASKSAGTFNLGTDTFLASPFIRVQYQVPRSTWYQFYLNGESPKIDMWSLRRRFTLSADSQYLLITRNYRATRTGGCAAAGISVHNFKRGGLNNAAYHRYGCDAIVLNRAGVGVCMNAGNPAPVFPPYTDTNDRYANMLGWDKANKFMWRNILEPGNGGRVNFTHKCKTTPCPGGIYLPDSQHFGQ